LTFTRPSGQAAAHLRREIPHDRMPNWSLPSVEFAPIMEKRHHPRLQTCPASSSALASGTIGSTCRYPEEEEEEEEEEEISTRTTRAPAENRPGRSVLPKIRRLPTAN
jgi:hypothetical protein